MALTSVRRVSSRSLLLAWPLMLSSSSALKAVSGGPIRAFLVLRPGPAGDEGERPDRRELHEPEDQDQGEEVVRDRGLGRDELFLPADELREEDIVQPVEVVHERREDRGSRERDDVPRDGALRQVPLGARGHGGGGYSRDGPRAN